MAVDPNDTHRKTVGHLPWIFGFTGPHRSCCGKPVTGTFWFFELGLFLVGWLYDVWTPNGQVDVINRRGRTRA